MIECGLIRYSKLKYMHKLTRNGKSKLSFLPIVFIIIILTSLFSGCIKAKNNQNPPEMSYYFNYDNDGRLNGYVDAERNNIKYAYDEKGQIVETVYPDRKVQYNYDTLGNLLAIKDGEGLVEFQYDAYNRLTKAKYKHSPERSIEFDYDPWDRIEKMRIIDNNKQVVNSLGYQYDMFSRLKSIDTSKGLIEYSYYPVENKMIRQYPNGIKSTFIYSPQMLPVSLKHEDKLGNLLAEYKYDYDASGHVIRAFENFPDIGIQETKYDWDNRGYLTGWTKPDGTTISYEYDMMGNRISKTDSSGTLQYKYDNFARLSQAGDVKYKWDKTGKLTSQIEGKRVTKIEYNGLDLPSVIKTPDATIRYDWDAAGNILSKQQDNKITYSLPNPLNPPGSVIAEFDEMGHISNSYIYGNGLLAQQDATGDTRYFLEDGFNSIRHVTSMNGNILGQQDYSPFGEPYAVKGDNVADFYSSGVKFLPEIKTSLIGNRLYDPFNGRYLSFNPEPGYVGSHDSFNKYTYGSSDPSNFFEPRSNQNIEQQTVLGREGWDWPGNFIGRVFNLNWFGRNVGGGKWYVYGLDEHNQFPLGDTKVPGVNSLDEAARKHDIQYYINTHFHKEGTWVKVPGPIEGQYEYFRSRGSATVFPAWGTNLVLLGDSILSFGNFAHHGVLTSLPPGQTAIPLYEDSAKSNDLNTGNYFDYGNRQLDEFYDDSRKYFKPLCPPFCDDGNGGSGGGAGINPLPKTPFSNEKELGGINLSAKASLIGDLGRLTAAVYDNETGSLILVGDGNISLPTLSQEDLRVAFELARSGNYAQFSLDPADPKNPRGDWLKAVYIPENILKGTKFGNELFEADWLLKQYSFGVKVDDMGATSKLITNVDGFKNMFDLGFESFNEGKKETWNRFWIVNNKATLRKTENGIYFDEIDMDVKTEEMHFTGTELKGNDKEDPDALKFADFFSSHYNEFAKESPSFARVKEMAKAVALANWLVEIGIPIDMTWFSNANVKDKEFEDHMQALSQRSNYNISETAKGNKFVDQVHSLSEDQEKSSQREYEENGNMITETSTRTMNLFGGVDLTVKPDYIADDGHAKRIREKVREAIRENPGQIEFDLQDNGQKFKGIILPITQSGISLWEDLNGGISNAEFIRKDEGKNQNFNLELDGGWTANAEKKQNGDSEFTFTAPNEHKFQYQYDPEGYLYQLNVDNNKVAEYQYDSQTRTLVIGYNGWKEYITYDNGGRVQSYKRVPSQGRQQQSEEVQFNYDQGGRMKGIDYGELGKINFEYKGDLLASALTPWSEFSYAYDSENRLTAISESGNTVNFQYDGTLLRKASADFQSQTSEIIFENGLLKEMRGFTGENMKYEYNEAGLLKSATDSQGAKAVYHYDDRLRLNRIELPGGSSEEYIYGIVGKKGDTKERLLKKVVNPIHS